MESKNNLIIKPILEINGYYAGEDGNIYSTRAIGNNQHSTKVCEMRKIKERLSTAGGSKNLYVRLPRKNGKGFKNYKVASLVAEAFYGTRPDDTECSHINGDSLDNRSNNLIWETHKINCGRRLNQGSQAHGTKHGMCKLTDEDLAGIRENLSVGILTQRKIAELFNTTQQTVSRIYTKKTHIHT